MNPSKPSFLRNWKPKTQDKNWRVSVFGWECAPDGTVSGEVVDAVETNDLNLAILAAHRMLDLHAPKAAKLVTLEIAAAELIDKGAI